MDPNQTEDAEEPDFEANYEGEGIEKIGEESEDEYSSGSDYVTGMSHADKKKHHLEYRHLLKEIANQNKTVDLLKEKLTKMCHKGSLTPCEIQEIKKIRACMENENLKLQCLVRKAIQMQNEYPIHSWDEVPIVTTIEDDVFPHISNVMAVLGLAPEQVDDRENGGECCGGCPKDEKCNKPDGPDKEICELAEEMALKDQMLECLKEKLHLLQCHSMVLEQSRTCGRGPPGCCRCAEDNVEVVKCTVDIPPRCCKCAENNVEVTKCTVDIPPGCCKCAENNVEVTKCTVDIPPGCCKSAENNFEVKKCIVDIPPGCCKCAENNVEITKCTVDVPPGCCKCAENHVEIRKCTVDIPPRCCKCAENNVEIRKCTVDIPPRCCKCAENNVEIRKCTVDISPGCCKCPANNVENMRCNVDKLKREIASLCKEKEDALRKQCPCYVCRQFPVLAPLPNTIEMRKVENYPPYQIKYDKKRRKGKGHCLERYTTDPTRKPTCPSPIDCELKCLREKVKNLCEEQEEYTNIIKDQAEQLDGYRKQYLCAQQIVEDQKAMLDKIDMSKKCIESQIEAEVARINAKLEDQLCELSQYPKLLEDEQTKLANACKDRAELEDKLRVLCKELTTVKEQISRNAEKRCERRRRKKRSSCSSNNNLKCPN